MSMIAFPPEHGGACGSDSSACACARAHGARSERARTQAGYGRIDGGGRSARPCWRTARWAAVRGQVSAAGAGQTWFRVAWLACLVRTRLRASPHPRRTIPSGVLEHMGSPLWAHRDCCANARMRWARRGRIAILVTKTFRARCAKRTVFTASIDGEGNEHGRES